MANKYHGLNRTGIEYADFTLNPIVGCKRDCRDLYGNPYCYAKREVEHGRFREQHNWPHTFDEVSYYPRKVDTIRRLAGYKRRPSTSSGRDRARIFLCDMADMLGPWARDEWISDIIKAVRECTQHDFLILTKSYDRIGRWDYPGNVWLGASVDRREKLIPAVDALRTGGHGGVKWLSVEPMLEDITPELFNFEGVDWIVVGALTGPYAEGVRGKGLGISPELENLRKSAEMSGVPVFEKDNMHLAEPMREFPKIGRTENVERRTGGEEPE